MLVQALSSEVVLRKMAQVCGAKTKTTPARSFSSKVVKDMKEPNASALHGNNIVPQKTSVVRSTSPSVFQMTQWKIVPSNLQQDPIPPRCPSPQQLATSLQQSIPQSQSTPQQSDDLPPVEFQVDAIVDDSGKETSARDQLMAFLSPNALMEVDRSKSYSKLTKTLLAALFDRATLQRSSLTGKGCGEMLDSGKIKLITDYVVLAYPGVTTTAIRNAITQKIKDEKEACKRKRRAEEGQK